MNRRYELQLPVLDFSLTLFFQEMTRKLGFTIQLEEEKLRIQLEALQSQLSAPTQFKGRLNELLSQVRLQSQVNGLGSSDQTNLDHFARYCLCEF